ncbi:hypothetical protein [Rhodococcus sp. IEGM 1379]|uniref:hypothetical protein n=1 Tax=Rhodococcus sp. IEGM 1379 TaxID=3047086 RepID=UPI0024B874B0|nr:hypothetical protein [Rhodococcus sp. IEGM 1379]MDI9917314.1 hypothetical protein [Rhodococcus sp. IEGM 1379]
MNFHLRRTPRVSMTRFVRFLMAAVGLVVLSATSLPLQAVAAPIVFPPVFPCGPINPCPPPGPPPAPQSVYKFISLHYHIVDPGGVGGNVVYNCKPFSWPSNSCRYTYGNYTAGHTAPFTDGQQGIFSFGQEGNRTNLYFEANGSYITGSIPSRASDEFTLTGFQIPAVGVWDGKPANPNASTGDRQGKLRFVVNALPNYFDGIGYDIYLTGYVAVNPTLGSDNPFAGSFGSS